MLIRPTRFLHNLILLPGRERPKPWSAQHVVVRADVGRIRRAVDRAVVIRRDLREVLDFDFHEPGYSMIAWSTAEV